MTNRVQGYLVTLEKDMREDDAQTVISALGMVRGVLSVEPVQGKGLETEIAMSRIRHALLIEVYKLIQQKPA